MKSLRLTEILPSLIAARAWAPWVVAPRGAADLRALQRRVAAARLGGGSHPVKVRERLFDDVQ